MRYFLLTTDKVCTNGSDVFMEKSDCVFTCYPVVELIGYNPVQIQEGRGVVNINDTGMFDIFSSTFLSHQ